MLPGAGTTFSFKSAGKTVLLSVNKLRIECEKVKGTGKATSDPLGEATFIFENCESVLGIVKAKCTGLSDTTTGNITVNAEYHLRYLLPSPNSGVQLAILLAHVHFSCGIVLVLVLGCVSSMDLEKAAGGTLGDELVKSIKVDFLQENGQEKPAEIDNEAGTAMETCVLKVMTGANVDEEAGQQGEGTIEAFKNGTETEVLMMH
jgi:hypothetical protein